MNTVYEMIEDFDRTRSMFNNFRGILGNTIKI